MPESESLPHGFSSHSHHDAVYHSFANATVKGTFGIEWPDASLHPFFYVGVYGSIGLLVAFANVLSVTAQYTAALRASRVLFKYVHACLTLSR